MIPPENAWLRRSNNDIIIGCYSSQQTWQLKCDGRQWKGLVGTCPELCKIKFCKSYVNHTLIIIDIYKIKFVPFSHFWTPQCVWWLKSGNATASHQLFETIYTGCSCVNEWTLRSVYPSTFWFPPARSSVRGHVAAHSSDGSRNPPSAGATPLISVIWPHRRPINCGLWSSMLLSATGPSA